MGLIVRACVFALVAACAPIAAPSGQGPSAPGASTSPTVSPAPSVDRVTGWRSDLEELIPGMDRIHPKLDHGTPMADLQAAVVHLEARVPTATDDELMVGLLGIVAMVSAAGCDAHTGAYIWGEGSGYPVDSLPLRLWWFDEGLYVVDALDPYRDLIGARIDTIEGHPTAVVTAAIQPLVPRDNATTVRLLMPRFVLVPQVLRGLGLADAGPVDLDTVGGDGQPRHTSVNPISMAAYNGWAGPYGLHLPRQANVPYLSRLDDLLWWQPLPDDPSTLFVQYSRVEAIPSTQVAALTAALADPAVDRVVLDIRHNYGGEVSALGPVLSLFQGWAAAHPGRLVLVTGRNTFSAASLLAARLAAPGNIVVAGEPMGGCPTAYGDSSDLRLPYSGIVVSVAGSLEVGVAADDRRTTIEPDLAAPLTAADWAAGLDPVLAALAAEGP